LLDSVYSTFPRHWNFGGQARGRDIKLGGYCRWKPVEANRRNKMGKRQRRGKLRWRSKKANHGRKPNLG